MRLAAELAQAGQVVDSAVGGETCRRNRDAHALTSVAFWGICDIKYDLRLPEGERIKVLELGDGKSSRFSHHGRPIKEKFDREYCMDKDPPPIKRAMLVENKKFTHDMFVKEGHVNLRPATVSFPRLYQPNLAKRVLSKLTAGKGQVPSVPHLHHAGICTSPGASGPLAASGVVLKLCNRSRGAGVVVVRADVAELDAVLKRLLTPLHGAELNQWLDTCTHEMLHEQDQDVLTEQCLHWWSNECPVFVAEALCSSTPVAKEPGSDQKFDGTMRVAFALHRKQRVNKMAHMTGTHEAVKPFEIDWLGGYWKLPKEATSETSGGATLEQMQDRVVSSFNSVDKRTAEVPESQLLEIYAALTPALPVIFHTGAFNVPMILALYRDDPLFCAFALSRVAATLRAGDMNKARSLYEMAKKYVPAPTTHDHEDLAQRSVLSYIERNEGVCHALLGEWEEAFQKFDLSLRTLPTNSTSYYMIGCYQQERGMYTQAIPSMLMSIALDPDFKSPYVALGNCHLVMRNFETAINASAACLRRNPDAPQAQFIIGEAIYHMMHSSARPPVEDLMREKAIAALEIAKTRMPGNWTAEDDEMLLYLNADGTSRWQLEEVPVHIWKVPGWRP